MHWTIQNQLTEGEIRRGIVTYGTKRVLLPLLPAVALLFVMFYVLEGSALVAGGTTLVGAILAGIMAYFMLRSQLSPHKIAVFHLYDEVMDIVGSSGAFSRFAYRDIRVDEDRDIFILTLPQRRFAVVAKGRLEREQEDFFRRLAGR